MVEIFAFLDLDQISADFEIEHFSKVSACIESGLFQIPKGAHEGMAFADIGKEVVVKVDALLMVDATYCLPSISSNRDAIGVAANIPGRSALFPFVRVKIEKVPRP